MYSRSPQPSPPRQRDVSFDEGAMFVTRHSPSFVTTRIVEGSSSSSSAPIGRFGGQDEDDSLAPVISTDAGAGRAHTPLKQNRTNTPQRPRSSSLLHTAAAPVQPPTLKGGGDVRRQAPGRRKQRRWENDNLLGVEKFLRGRHAHEEGDAEHLTISHSWRSSLSVLVSDKNNSASAAEVRESVRKGLQPSRPAEENSSRLGSRHFAGGKWADAEERFLLVEKRLRDIVVRALRNSALLTFVVGLETLLEAFTQHQQALGSFDTPQALSTALASRPSVESGSSKSSGATLLVPLGPSPFHRLLLHALCQYRKLRSRSEETSDGRTVRVTLPASGLAPALPRFPLTEFVVQTRLRESGGCGDGRGAVSQVATGTALCGRGTVSKRLAPSAEQCAAPSSAVGVA